MAAASWCRPAAGYQALCRELAAAGPGTFGELDSTGARSVLRRYSDAWFAAATRRKAGDASSGSRGGGGRCCRCGVTTAPSPGPGGGCGYRPPRLSAVVVRLDRDVPYPAEQVRSVTLLYADGRLWVEVTAEVPVTAYPAGTDRTRTGSPASTWGSSTRTRSPDPMVQALLVSGRAIRAEHRLHLADTKRPPPRDAARAPARVSGDRGGGARPGAGPGRSRAGTGAGSGRRSMRPRRPSSAGPCSSGSAR